MNLWLDDERPMPEGYDYHARTAEEAIQLIQQGKVNKLSLDHDLGEGLSGYDVVKVIEEGAFMKTIAPIELSVHSQNCVGVYNMLAGIAQAKRFWTT